MSTETRQSPFWWDAATPPDSDSQTLDPQCDVAIVGAGYTGLSAALTLVRAGRSVQVFDRQRPGEGASTRNGGVVSGNIRFSFGGAVERFGLERARAIYGEGQRAREDLWRFLEEESIDCDFRLVGRFTGAVRASQYEGQAREVELLNKHLDIGAYMLSHANQGTEIGSDLYHGGIVRPDIGVLHPAKFHAGMLQRALQAGASVHGETPVLGIRRDGETVEITTARGRVRARDVLVATNGYTDRSLPWLQRRLIPVTSRIVATEPLPVELMDRLIPNRRTVVEARKLYRYYRPSPDGLRLLLGGRESTFSNDVARNTAHVRGYLLEVFPELADVRITHSWAGYVAFNLDDLPRLFVHDGMHFAVGYCGSGVVWARWLGKKAAQQILGDPEAQSAFTSHPPAAVPLYWGKPWFLPMAVGLQGLQDRYGIGDKRLT